MLQWHYHIQQFILHIGHCMAIMQYILVQFMLSEHNLVLFMLVLTTLS